MPQVDRFTVSLDTELLAAFDRHIHSRGYENRSEAIRDLIRELLVRERMSGSDEPVSAFLTAVCDHRESEVSERIHATLADHSKTVASVFHLPIDENRDYLAVALTGEAEKVQRAADQLQTLRGITHAHLSAVPTAE